MSDKGKGDSTKKRFAFGTLVIGVILGVILWGGFNWTLELTNTEEFCVSCHEMETTPYQELQETIHWSNRTGVRATCPDCHVPRPWIHKLVRKVRASNELYHHFVTKALDTPEKYEAKRLELAKNVWRSMKETNSRECRNCHDYESMDFGRQEGRAADRHEEMDVEEDVDAKHAVAAKAGLTCIDCHKGIAHSLPAGYDPEKDIAGESLYYD
jgi:cytochrome c-type protein NapC